MPAKCRACSGDDLAPCNGNCDVIGGKICYSNGVVDIPLFRTEGKAFTPGTTLSPQLFAQLPLLQRASKSKVTQLVEADFDLGDCLYFYSGHACPDFGDVVLVYRAAMFDAELGNATSFDTGGLHAGYVHICGALDVHGRKSYCATHSCVLNLWRTQASKYVGMHFTSAADYVMGAKPTSDDASGRLLHAQNERRAWTWEVRPHRDHPIEKDLIGIWMAADYFQAVRNELMVNGSRLNNCRKLITTGVVKSVRAGLSPHSAAEKEVASCL